MIHIKAQAKVNNFFLKSLFYILILSLFSCGKKTIKDPQEFMKWINNPENGLVKSKSTIGVKIDLKYLPPSYLAYQEMKDGKNKSAETRDSLISYYSQSITFLMIIGPDEKEKKNTGDIMYRDITKFDDYKDRAHIMNFEISEYVNLETEKGKYKPVIANLENIYGLVNERKIMFVFPRVNSTEDLTNSKELDFVFTDEIYNTGINHFVFTQEQIKKVPNFIF
jgi:hypothetical protein